MVGRRFLLIAGLITSFTLVSPSMSTPTDTSTANCSQADLKLGTCHVSTTVNGDRVDVGATTGSSGSTSGGSGAGGSAKGGFAKGGSGSSTGKRGPSKTNSPAPADPLSVDRGEFGAIAPLTISDLASFTPRAGIDHMQPAGWAIIGLDTNFYATVGSEVFTGTVLGQPASVRFIPTVWHWSYGDGTTATRATGGATWAAQGVQQFDPTATSHVYRKSGTYSIDLSIEFGAEYEYVTGEWAPVEGTVTVPANQLRITAGSAKTVLVNQDCSQNPGGPGC